jgi:hypothetical protein
MKVKPIISERSKQIKLFYQALLSGLDGVFPDYYGNRTFSYITLFPFFKVGNKRHFALQITQLFELFLCEWATDHTEENCVSQICQQHRLHCMPPLVKRLRVS